MHGSSSGATWKRGSHEASRRKRTVLVCRRRAGISGTAPHRPARVALRHLPRAVGFVPGRPGTVTSWSWEVAGRAGLAPVSAGDDREYSCRFGSGRVCGSGTRHPSPHELEFERLGFGCDDCRFVYASRAGLVDADAIFRYAIIGSCAAHGLDGSWTFSGATIFGSWSDSRGGHGRD